jgi:hypothetical protein
MPNIYTKYCIDIHILMGPSVAWAPIIALTALPSKMTLVTPRV